MQLIAFQLEILGYLQTDLQSRGGQGLLHQIAHQSIQGPPTE